MPITIAGSGTITGITAGGLPDGVITTDDIAASAITRAKMGYAGAVLQVVSGTTAKSVDVTTTSNSYIDTGLFNVSITPVAAGSKFFVCFSGYHPHVHAGNGNYGCAYMIYRNINSAGDTPASSNHVEGYFQATGSSGQWFDYAGHSTILDTPPYSLGNSISYKLFGRKTAGTGTAYLHHNGGVANGTDGAYVVHTIMEIAG